MEEIREEQFFDEFLIEGDVDKVFVVNDEFVEVFIKNSKLL